MQRYKKFPIFANVSRICNTIIGQYALFAKSAYHFFATFLRVHNLRNMLIVYGLQQNSIHLTVM